MMEEADGKGRAASELEQVSLKDKGNEFFKAGNYLKAAALYTQAIKQDPSNPTLYRYHVLTSDTHFQIFKWRCSHLFQFAPYPLAFFVTFLIFFVIGRDHKHFVDTNYVSGENLISVCFQLDVLLENS